MTAPSELPAANVPGEKQYVLAIDLGTTGLKVGLVSVTGEIAWTADAQLTTTFLPHGGADVFGRPAEEFVVKK